MTIKISASKNVLSSVRIETDIALWQMLLQGVRRTHKLSRIEAFYDLIDRQCVSMLKGNDSLNGSINEIAKAWGWDRETVSRFLESLEKLGTLSVETQGNRKTVRMNCITLPKDDSGAFLPSQTQ